MMFSHENTWQHNTVMSVSNPSPHLWLLSKFHTHTHRIILINCKWKYLWYHQHNCLTFIMFYFMLYILSLITGSSSGGTVLWNFNLLYCFLLNLCPCSYSKVTNWNLVLNVTSDI
jgi:hypothetical protein